MKENLYQLIKERDTHFPESIIRNMMFQVVCDINHFGRRTAVNSCLSANLGTQRSSIHASPRILPSWLETREFAVLGSWFSENSRFRFGQRDTIASPLHWLCINAMVSGTGGMHRCIYFILHVQSNHSLRLSFIHLFIRFCCIQHAMAVASICGQWAAFWLNCTHFDHYFQVAVRSINYLKFALFWERPIRYGLVTFYFISNESK